MIHVLLVKQLCVPGDKHSNVLSMQEDSGIGESVNDGKHAVPFCKEMFRAILNSIFSSCREFVIFMIFFIAVKCYEDFVTCKGAEAQAGNIDAKIGMWS